MPSPMLTKAGIYLDSNAGAPLCPAAFEAILPYVKEFGSFIPNPSSIHSYGRVAKRALAQAREQIAASLGPQVDSEQILFTSSGSEANQLAIRSVLESEAKSLAPPHWITTPVEHDSIRQMTTWWEERGGVVSFLPVDSEGVPQVEKISELIRPETRLVSAMWVNNETGVITDIQRLAQLTRARSVPLHVDAAQAWGKLPIDLQALGAQYVSFSGHKIGGFSGIGVLWLARGHAAKPQILGKQEKGRRGGTENVIGAIALGAAAQHLRTQSNFGEWSTGVGGLRDRLQSAICEQIPGTWVNGKNAPRVANTLNLSFDGVEGDGLVMALDLAGYSVSSGSACASGVLEPSHVLMAMGRTRLQAMAAIRISLAEELPWENLEGFVGALQKVVLRVREASR